jgi:hypothetical protein
MGHTDWERFHRPPGLVESNGALAVTGSGDIGPAGSEGGRSVEDALVGLAIGLVIVMAVAVRFAAEHRPDPAGAIPLSGRILAARAVVIGAVAFLAGLVAAAVAVRLVTEVPGAGGGQVLAASALTELRVVAGVAALVAVAAVAALGLGALLGRSWPALLVAISTVVLPYLVAAVPLLPDEVSRWLLRLTPAAGFAVQQTVAEHPQVVAHYAPSAGYFPLAWWAGLAVLCAYTAAVLALAALRLRRPAVASQPRRWIRGGRPRADRAVSGGGRPRADRAVSGGGRPRADRASWR